LEDLGMTPDVVCIGAINYDYVYAGRRGFDEPKGQPDVGREQLDAKQKELSELIKTAISGHSIISEQVGGSAFLAAKTIFEMHCGLGVGFVGMLGTGSTAERVNGLSAPAVKAVLDDTQWLFESKSPPGRSLVHISKGQRLEIRIAPGANNQLLGRIKSSPTGLDGLVNYLASARWIHVTSLPTFAQFSVIIEQVRLAKATNPSLRCSVDPGYDYVKNHREDLIEALGVADLVFLSGGEADLLSPVDDASSGRGPFANAPFRGPSKLIVIKGKARSLLVERLNGGTWVRTYWHSRLFGFRIKNDTGAGDVFAGGFIASLLMESLLGSQPSASRLAAQLAAARLKSLDFPTDELKRITDVFIEKGRRRESRNRTQHLQALWDTHKGWIGFLGGIALTYLLTRLLGLS
jgi:sugar/nucleoside kinase (ribokinase family)